MGLQADKVRASKVLASAKALGIHVEEDLHGALKSHNAPHDQVFDKNINSTARLFMRNVAKHKATPTLLKLSGHPPPPQHGLKCILLVDSDRLRRDDLTAELADCFKLAVAGTKKDAMQVLQMMSVHLILARIRFQKDTAEALLLDCLRRHVTVPVIVYVTTTAGNEEQLAKCMEAGACGYLEEGLPPDILRQRLLDAWRQFRPKVADTLDHRRQPPPLEHTISTRTAVINGFRRASKMPDGHENNNGSQSTPSLSSLTALDMKIQDRQNFLVKQQHIQQAMTTQHSVLGLGRGKVSSALNKDLHRAVVPAPSRLKTIECMYTRPHTVATLVQEHDYNVVTQPDRDAVPQEPLLTHCIIVDPATICDAKTVLKRINRGYLAYQAGQFEAAINWCTASLKAEPNHMPKWCYLLRGAIFDELGDHGAAIADFDAALALDAAFHQAQFNRSVSFLKLGKDVAALAAIVAAQENPELPLPKPIPDYVRNHALILRRMGRYEDARVVYAKLAKDATNSDRDAPSSLDGMLAKAGLSGGLFDALFCQSKDEKAAFFAEPGTRTDAMLDTVVSKLFEFDFFARCPDAVLRTVAQALVHVVVRNGETFYLAHDHPHAFYICLQGTLSVHANLTLAGQELDTMASSSTHRLRPGDVFGCVGVSISSLLMYLADERTEIMYLSPTAFKETLEPQWLVEQHSRFSIFRRSPVFRMISDSELGHIVSHSILVRFHKGDVLVQQHEYPKHLYILYKGICRFEQTFSATDHRRMATTSESAVHSPSAATSGGGPQSMASVAAAAAAAVDKVMPYHHLMDIPHWPMNFTTNEAHDEAAKKHRSHHVSSKAASDVKTPLRGRPPTIAYDIYPPALFGESAYKTLPEKSQCSIVAATLVEALAVDMHQLKSLNSAKELFTAIVCNAPLYVDANKALKLQKVDAEWKRIRGKEAIQVNKMRWPVDKERLRYLPNGGSIVVPDEKISTDKVFR
ncbi:Aste57867_21334 [Aphanomyces stellatus]|uniref:Aste57867_21334 protein n=1 Tax=Aphanomyces stellatus TaxID=120398 RepID=A0A485LHX7_9STRA|nr:hypothetical protein As57867_021265 [Aphanomyces stellatus]VFT98006.1 Aste57867_21334 [Aphanomyces stellatus]